MTYFQSEENYHDRRLQDKKRTIYIDTVGVSILDFNLTESQMQSLIYSGYTAASKFAQSLKDTNQHFLLSAPLLSSLLKIYDGHIELNNEFRFNKSRLNYDSIEIPNIIYTFYSKGTDQEIEYFKKLKFKLSSVNDLGDTVFHIAAKLKDKACMEKLLRFNSNESLAQYDIKNLNGDFAFDLVRIIPNKQEQVELAQILFNNGFRNAIDCPDKSSIIAMLSFSS